MQEDKTGNNYSDYSAKPPNSLQKLADYTKKLSNLPFYWKISIGLIAVAILLVVSFGLYANVPEGEEPGAAIDFPQEINDVSPGWEVIKFVDDIVHWVVVNWDPFFSTINTIIRRGILTPLEDFFLWLPWWSIFIITAFFAWRTNGVKFAGISVIFLLIISFMGLLDMGSQTLAITMTSAIICVAFGLPLGILAAKSDRYNSFQRPILDMMQTMPSFVYLIPAVMLFGTGPVPAVMATFIYAVPPIIRLTALGIRQVDPQVIEASKSFGTTSWQLLIRVQTPMALPTILAGLNQTVMMALAMVVIASMIGAEGLGVEVLNGIARLEVGRGFLGGISIVFMAIILDRISQGFAKRREPSPGT